MPVSDQDSLQVSVSEVVDFLRIDGGFSKALSDVVRRKYLLRAADSAGIQAAPEELQRAADAYRALNGLHKAADTERWMANNGITVDKLEKHLEENIRISKARDHIADEWGPRIADAPAVKKLVRELAVEDWLAHQAAD